MKDELEVLKQIRWQVAHCLENYSNAQEELTYKLETLVCEWFMKGINARERIKLECPYCNKITVVYHLDWDAIVCVHCKTEVKRKEWINFNGSEE